MNIPVDINTLETLYQNGQITGTGLAEIAPILWLIENHPELMHSEAIANKTKTCKACVNFSSIHQCCMSRIDKSLSYIPVTATSEACIDYEEVALPYFLQTGGNDV